MNKPARKPHNPQHDNAILVKPRRMTSALWSCELHKEVCFTANEIEVEVSLSRYAFEVTAASTCLA